MYRTNKAGNKVLILSQKLRVELIESVQKIKDFFRKTSVVQQIAI